MAIQFIDLCSGIGGFHSGLMATGHYKCVGHAEIDPNAAKAYKAIYGEEGGMNYGDLREIDPKQLPDFDLLCAGFPCQSFSVAGRRLGFQDTRGTVFFEIARIIAEKRPPFLLLENVPGLLSHDGGRTLTTIFSSLVEMGYHLEWMVLNSKYFGVPQQRRRLYIVGYLDARCAGKVFPLGSSYAKNLKQLIPGAQGQRVYETDGVACTQCASAGGWGGKTGLYFIDMNVNPKITEVARCITARQDSGVSNHRGEHSAVLIEDEPPRAMLTPDREKVRQKGRRLKEPDEPMFTITAQDKHGICFYDIYRAKLIPVTPEEVVRQKIAHWCVKKMQVPPQVIILEQHLSHYQIPSRDRADIIIHEETETGLLPLAVIECKATSVALSEKTFHQCFSYSELLQTEYAIITNGVELLAYKYNAETNEYDLLSEPPTYFQMLGREATIEEPHEIVPRPSYASLFSERTQQRYVDDYIIGAATSVEYRAYAINLLEALLDEEDTLQKRSSSFELIKDLGVRILSYGNAAGFDYVAPYRSFLIKDKTGNNQIISLGFNAYGNDKTILCVAIDDFRKSHHALQLLFDKYMTIHNGVMMFKHNGQISVGHRGSASASELIRVVKEECAQLVDEKNKINLGAVDANNDIHLSSDDMTSFVYNLLEYALIRDEYRDSVKEKRT